MKWDMPKSLHTVTALVNVAEHLITTNDGLVSSRFFLDCEEGQSTYHRAIYVASRILGYYPVSMPPAIYDQAISKLTKKMEN